MLSLRRGRAHPALVSLCVLAPLALSVGCASPGPPRPPSLQLPQLVSDLSATRSGDAVELRFTIPARTTDGQPLRATTVTGVLCREATGSSACTPVNRRQTQAALPVPAAGATSSVRWTDSLPASLATGAPAVLAYRVELQNPDGRSAGFSDRAYTASGSVPPAVAGFAAEGTRQGIELRWQPAPGGGEVLLQRTDLGAPTSQAPGTGSEHPTSHRRGANPGEIWLEAGPGSSAAAATMDRSASEGVSYRYIAVRREMVQIGGRKLELRSAPSAAVTVTWRDVYPPAIPEGLTALGYRVGPGAPSAPGAPQAGGGYAVDLVWQPVEDPRLAGYLVYRRDLDAEGKPAGERIRLTPQPVPSPGYHDATAVSGMRYRYSVTAVDGKGNESGAAETVVEPVSGP